MTPFEMEKRIREAVKSAITDGWEVRGGLYYLPADPPGRPKPFVCPLGACCRRELAENRRKQVRVSDGEVVTAALRINAQRMIAIQSGVDDVQYMRTEINREWFDLGVRLRTNLKLRRSLVGVT